MQIVSTGDNLHEMSKFSGKNKKNINLSSAELAQRTVKEKQSKGTMIGLPIYHLSYSYSTNFKIKMAQHF